MSTVDRALQTQIENLQKRSGKSLDELYEVVAKSGLEKHGEIRGLLKLELGMGHGDANMVAALYLKRGQEPAESSGDPLEAIYVGPKADLRLIHDAIMAHVSGFGEFETAPKKAYVSLRRTKQFAMIGPATRTQVEVGLNVSALPGADRLKKQKPGAMCQYSVRLSDVADVDAEFMGWIRAAFDAAG